MSEQSFAPGSELPDADINAIMRMIPHRYPFLLIDRVVEMRAFERAVGIKAVTINEWFFQGHFPGDPIMPGVLLIEAMAQTAAVLAVAGLGDDHQGHPVYFMSIDGARFRRPVRPGDQLRLETTSCAASWACGSSPAKPMATVPSPPKPSSAPRSAIAERRSALRHRDVAPLRMAGVALARPADLLLGIFDHLVPLRHPARPCARARRWR